MASRTARIALAALAAIAAIVLYPLLLKPEEPSSPKVQGRNNTVLFIANVERGLSNVHLATAHALLLDQPQIEVHFATWKKLEKPIIELNENALKQNPKARSIVFHEITSVLNFGDAGKIEYDYGDVGEMMTPYGIEGIKRVSTYLQYFLLPWSAPDHIALYNELLQLFDEVSPAVVALDMFVVPALDAVRTARRNEVMVTPNSLKDYFAEIQPWGAVLWKYPAIASGLPYPIPWHQIPHNIYLTLYLAYKITWMPAVAEKIAYLKDHGISKPLNFFNAYRKDNLFITQSAPSLDFPLSIIPANVAAVGPIYLSTAPAEEQDAELATWLEQRPTVLINLGSHFNYDEPLATAMVGAIRRLFDETDVQVLWKFNKRPLKPDGTLYDDTFLARVSPELSSGRLRLSKWIPIDPATMLETGHIVLSVHHGGANCMHEALGTGVPSVVLPIWVDCYDHAQRAEMLGVGVWGNRKGVLEWTSEELGESMLRVVKGESGEGYRERAKALAEPFEKEKGVVKAARLLARVARGQRGW